MKFINIPIAVGGLMGAHAALVTASAYIDGKHSFKDSFCEVLIILGTRVDEDKPSEDLQLRIEAAAQYLKLHPLCIAIATGGNFRKGQKISEAQAIESGLISLGIKPERIFKDEKARTTYENFKNSLEIIDSLELSDPMIGVLTNDYHIFRAGLIAKDSGIENVIKISAPSKSTAAGLFRENTVIFEVWFKRLARFLKNTKEEIQHDF